MPYVEFTIDFETGNVEVQGEQFIGGACKAAIKPYLDKLGRVIESKPKVDQAIITRKVEQKL